MSPYKALPFIVVCLISFNHSSAQELFVYSEPASNMPARSVGIRLSNWLMNDAATARTNYHLIPEIMWGANKQLMLHAEGYLSNRSTALAIEGAALYAKYRFFSKDQLYRHLRLAAFARLSVNNADIHQEEIETNGHNTGYQLGLIGTQLLHKTALSLTIYSQQATDNLRANELPRGQPTQAINYTFSVGRLVLPRAYTSYKQTNFNVMVEVLAQRLLSSGRQYIDIAPSLQLIVNSQTRIDIGYRRQLYSTMQRTAPNGFMLRVEHLVFGLR